MPTISKVFERVIHDQMYEYFNQFNLLAEQQYGFRKQHSTEYAAIKLIDHVSKEMEAGKTPTSCTLTFTLTFEVLLSCHDTAFDLLKSLKTICCICFSLNTLKYILEYFHKLYRMYALLNLAIY